MPRGPGQISSLHPQPSLLAQAERCHRVERSGGPGRRPHLGLRRGRGGGAEEAAPTAVDISMIPRCAVRRKRETLSSEAARLGLPVAQYVPETDGTGVVCWKSGKPTLVGRAYAGPMDQAKNEAIFFPFYLPAVTSSEKRLFRRSYTFLIPVLFLLVKNIIMSIHQRRQ